MHDSTQPAEPPYPELLLPSRYPAYAFTSAPHPRGRSYTAQAKHLNTRPWCVVTTELTDFPRELREHVAQRA